MQTRNEPVSLATMEQGTVMERVNQMLEEAIKNCLDPNYDQTPRVVALKIKLKPNDRRDEVYPSFDYKVEKGKRMQKGTPWSVGLASNGKAVGKEFMSRQQALFENGGNVVPLQAAGGAAETPNKGGEGL